MKKILKIILVILFIGVSIYGIKFLYDLSFSGTQEIKIIENYNDISSINELINQPEFKHKILYIDLWGVYCKPCIYQFQFMPEIKNKFKGKDIAYIYLATPYGHINDEQLWKSKMKKYKLEGHHVLMNMDFYKNIWNQIPGMTNKWAIPHYVLVDKNGKIVNANAPLPQNQTELYLQINALIDN